MPPVQAPTKPVVSADPSIVVIFGASGDLASRKLLPALYEMDHLGFLPKATRIIGVARRDKSDDEWREELRASAAEHATNFDAAAWQSFAQRVFYHAADATKPEDYAGIAQRLKTIDPNDETKGNILFFLSVAPALYAPITRAVGASEMVVEGRRWCTLDPANRSWQRVVIEKPFGHDAASAAELNRELAQVFDETAIFRIDHYLAKDVVQSTQVLRFANTIFEPVWNHRYIDHVQISACETLGVEDRVAFYDQTGALRDMIQSHLMQVFAFIAMEPPARMAAQDIQAEKLKVVRSIRPVGASEVTESCAFGQYGGGPDCTPYVDLPGVAKGSTTETYAAIRLEVDNWRWAGTPFYFRSGKRLAEKRTEVVVQFKAPAADLFRGVPHPQGRVSGNRLILRIAPQEGARLTFASKVPGQGIQIRPTHMDVDFQKEFGSETVEAYGPLFIDAMRGDQTLFKHRLEVEGAWDAVMPYLDGRSAAARVGIASNYAPASWGPACAEALMARDGRAWNTD